MTTYKGIDYGHGLTNINHKTGIRYGVISASIVGQFWYDESEADYGKAHCPKCGTEVWDLTDTERFESDGKIITMEEIDQWERDGCMDYVCLSCRYVFDSIYGFPDEPLCYYYEKEGYKITEDTYGDLFVLDSPYYTFAQFCSPCAPGAVHLENPLNDIDTSTVGPTDLNNRGYCLGHDWYESGKAPYPVYSVETGELIK